MRSYHGPAPEHLTGRNRRRREVKPFREGLCLETPFEAGGFEAVEAVLGRFSIGCSGYPCEHAESLKQFKDRNTILEKSL